MPAQHQTEYCHVSKSGEILEGPKALPQNWGSVAGFCHLKGKDLTKHNWYPVREDMMANRSSDYKLLFLPEHEVVLKVSASGGRSMRPTTQHALKQLYHMFGFFTVMPFYSEVLGEVHKFPNTEHEQRHRQNCLLVEEDYECMAEDLDRKPVRVVVPCDQIKTLIKDAVIAHNKELGNLFTGLEDIRDATDAQLAAILDTNLADYYG
jgi:hypothetical protein